METGEFGNVGVVLFSPTARYFGFKVLGQRYSRITNFFEQMDARLFRASMRATRDELQRVSDMLKGMGTDRRLKALDSSGAIALWQEMLKPRESMVRFSDSRLVMATDPQAKLVQLYAYYVERNFATKEYQEKLLERGVRGFLKDAQLQEYFHEQRVGNEEYNALFPFVKMQGDIPVKAIKPLRLDHALPAQIIDHGGQWRVRVEALKKRNLLPPDVLFAVNGLRAGESAQARARQEVVAGLRDLGVLVEEAIDREAVLDFARG
ncbi:MAG: DUF3037 domain-containing protein [Burkholderiaceae bacterium]|nr:DUF3037 domain-containing protein [Burkholderiaceae bacterium]